VVGGGFVIGYEGATREAMPAFARYLLESRVKPAKAQRRR